MTTTPTPSTGALCSPLYFSYTFCRSCRRMYCPVAPCTSPVPSAHPVATFPPHRPAPLLNCLQVPPLPVPSRGPPHLPYTFCTSCHPYTFLQALKPPVPLHSPLHLPYTVCRSCCCLYPLQLSVLHLCHLQEAQSCCLYSLNPLQPPALPHHTYAVYVYCVSMCLCTVVSLPVPPKVPLNHIYTICNHHNTTACTRMWPHAPHLCCLQVL